MVGYQGPLNPSLIAWDKYGPNDHSLLLASLHIIRLTELAVPIMHVVPWHTHRHPQTYPRTILTHSWSPHLNSSKILPFSRVCRWQRMNLQPSLTFKIKESKSQRGRLREDRKTEKIKEICKGKRVLPFLWVKFLASESPELSLIKNIGWEGCLHKDSILLGRECSHKNAKTAMSYAYSLSRYNFLPFSYVNLKYFGIS